MTESASRPHNSPEQADVSRPHPLRARRLTQLIVITATVICCALFVYGSKFVRVPASPGFEVSLLQQPAPFIAILFAVVLYIVSLMIGGWIGGNHWTLCGPFAAAVGLAMISVRGGASRYVYMHADDVGTGSRIFLLLFAEQLILFGAIAASWLLLAHRSRTAVGPADQSIIPTSQGWQALALGTGVTILLVLILTPTDQKKQVLAGVFVASFAGAGMAQHSFKRERLIAWIWFGPFVAGLVGYLINWFGAPGSSVTTGYLTGMFAGLARPLPLDYASAGTAGALLGYWMIGADDPAEIQQATDRQPTPGISANNGQIKRDQVPQTS